MDKVIKILKIIVTVNILYAIYGIASLVNLQNSIVWLFIFSIALLLQSTEVKNDWSDEQ